MSERAQTAAADTGDEIRGWGDETRRRRWGGERNTAHLHFLTPSLFIFRLTWVTTATTSIDWVMAFSCRERVCEKVGNVLCVICCRYRASSTDFKIQIYSLNSSVTRPRSFIFHFHTVSENTNWWKRRSSAEFWQSMMMMMMIGIFSSQSFSYLLKNAAEVSSIG